MSVPLYATDRSLAEEVQHNNRIPSRPLVGARWLRREASPLLARGPDRNRQSRYTQGFDPDWWLSALLASKWKSRWYPLNATRKSIEQWKEWTEAICVEYLGPFNQPETAEEIEASLLHDLALIRECAPYLAVDEGAYDGKIRVNSGDGVAERPAAQPTAATSIQAVAASWAVIPPVEEPRQLGFGSDSDRSCLSPPRSFPSTAAETATLPFTDADLKPVAPAAQRLLSLLEDPDAAADTVRHETQLVQFLIEYGPTALHVDVRDGLLNTPGGASRCTYDSSCQSKRIVAPGLSPDLRGLLDDLLAIDACHLERRRRSERIETVSLLKEFLRIADIRPDTPDSDYCVLEGAIRWETTVPAPRRSCALFAALLDSPRPVSIGLIACNFGWSTKTLRNEISQLRKLLALVCFPKRLQWRNDVLALV